MQYLFLANIALVAFFALYYLLLRKETFFQVNRVYLLGTALLSFIIPLFPLEWMNAHYSRTFIAEARFTLDEVLIGSVAQETRVRDSFWSRLTISECAYFLGLVIHILWLCHKFLHLRNNLEKPILSGQAFSFFKRIRVDEDQQGAGYIKAHEQVHAIQFHSLDIMVMECLHVFNWFNPFFYLLKREVKLNHEYIADEIVCHDHRQKVYYAEMLLHRAFMGINNNLVNHFKQKNLMKSRIKMLFQHRSARYSAFKYALVLPVVLCLMLFSSAKMPDRIEQILDGVPLENGHSDEKDFLKLVGSNFYYSQQARAQGTMGYVDIAFTKSGSTITELRLLNDPGDGLGEEGMRLLSKKEVVASAPEGKYILRIKLKLQSEEQIKSEKDLFDMQIPKLSGYKALDEVIVVGYPHNQQRAMTQILKDVEVNDQDAIKGDTIPSASKQARGKSIDFKEVEIQPVPFTGSLESFYRFIGENYQYPDSARKAGVNGQVILQFVIQKDGSLTDLKLLRDLGYGTGDEAIRVMQLSGKWKPGYSKGQPVNVSYSLPIRLNLQNQKEKATDSNASKG